MFNLASGEKLVDATVYELAADWAEFGVVEFQAQFGKAYAKSFEAETTKITASTEAEVKADKDSAPTAGKTERTIKIKAKDQYGEDFAIADKYSLEGSTLNGMPLTAKEIDFDKTNNDEIKLTRTLVKGDKIVIKVSNVGTDNKVLGSSDLTFVVEEAEAPVATSVAGVKATVKGKVAESVVANDEVKLTADVRDQFNTPMAEADVRYAVVEGADLLAEGSVKELGSKNKVVTTQANKEVKFTATKPGTVTIDVFNVKNGAKYTYTVEVGAQKLDKLTVDGKDATGFNKEEVKSAAIKPNPGAALTPEMLKFHVTDANGKVTEDVKVTAQLRGGDSEANKNDIIFVATSEKDGTYKVTPYVGETFTAEGVVKGNTVTVTTTLNNIATSIEPITVTETLKVGTPVKQAVVVKNKHGEDITELVHNKVELTAYTAAGKAATTEEFAKIETLKQNDKTKAYEAELKAEKAGDYTIRVTVTGSAATTEFAVKAAATELKSIDLGQDIYEGVISGDKATYQIISAIDTLDDEFLPEKADKWTVTATKAGQEFKEHGAKVVYVKQDEDGKWEETASNGTKAEGAEAIALKIDTTEADIKQLEEETVITYTVSTTVGDKATKVEDSIDVTISPVRKVDTVEVTPTATTVAIGGKQTIKVKPVDQYGDFIEVKTPETDIKVVSKDINKVAVDGTVTKDEKDKKVIGYKFQVAGKASGSAVVEVTVGGVKKEVNVTAAQAATVVDSIQITGDNVAEDGTYKYVLADQATADLSIAAFSGENEVKVNAEQVQWAVLEGSDIAKFEANGKIKITSAPEKDTKIKVQATFVGKKAVLEIPVVADAKKAAKIVPSTIEVKSAGEVGNVVTDLSKIDADPSKDGIQIALDGKSKNGQDISKNEITLTFTASNALGEDVTLQTGKVTAGVYNPDVATVADPITGSNVVIKAAGEGETKVTLSLDGKEIYALDVIVSKEVGDKVTDAAEKVARDAVLANGGATIANLQTLAGLSNALDVNTIVDANEAAYITAINALNEATATTADVQAEVNKVNAQQAGE
ncbi:hypothetical protein BN1050_01062 [Metalysinibacillus saudimassiliensis]|uniref:Uncharacterized protein n=1 Tax=Metalysinibacillus saudimassiliensis TaxID=1461583 RepID=A0A078M8Y7_9BACL|nr:hypothetical protein BN1050_01062 [Metalysinibacillus saudimassiliensis]